MLILKKEKTGPLVDFAVLEDHKVRIKESEKTGKYLDLAKELKKTVESTSDGDTIRSWCTWNGPQRFGKGTGSIQNQRKYQDHLDYNIIEIGRNTETWGDLLSLNCPVGLGCRIHRLHLSNECPGYDTKQSDGEVTAMLELWEMRSIPSLPLIPGLLRLGMGAPDRALSMG